MTLKVNHNGESEIGLPIINIKVFEPFVMLFWVTSHTINFPDLLGNDKTHNKNSEVLVLRGDFNSDGYYQSAIVLTVFLTISCIIIEKCPNIL